MRKERRKASQGDIVMAVIITMRWIGIILYGALAVCLGASIYYGLQTGKYELAIVTGLISAVSAGANSAGGFMAGVLSQTFNHKPTEPTPVVNAPGETLKTEPATENEETSTE